MRAPRLLPQPSRTRCRLTSTALGLVGLWYFRLPPSAVAGVVQPVAVDRSLQMPMPETLVPRRSRELGFDPVAACHR
jgi:hypothetical protein